MYFVRSHWEGGREQETIDDFAQSLKKLAEEFTKWGKKEFKNSTKIANKILDKIQCLQAGDWSNEIAQDVAELKKQLNEVWNQEEIYWAQKSRIQWLKAGDINTSFFHMATIKRRCRNKVTRLRGDDDRWHEDEETIGDCFANFCKKLFEKSNKRNFENVLQSVETVLTEEDNRILMQLVTEEEVKRAAFELGSKKAPGPDGYTGAFFQKFWHIVGPQVYASELPGNYLCLPIIWGRSKKSSLNFVVDWLKKKMQGWQTQFLSDAGREEPYQIWV